MILGIVLSAKDDLNPARTYRQSDQNKPFLALKLTAMLPNKNQKDKIGTFRYSTNDLNKGCKYSEKDGSELFGK